jgi:hypothetical protein
LVDALASGASGLTAVKVRVLSWAPLAPKPMISRKMRANRSADRHAMPGHGVDGLLCGSLIGLTSLLLRPSGALQFRSDRC